MKIAIEEISNLSELTKEALLDGFCPGDFYLNMPTIRDSKRLPCHPIDCESCWGQPVPEGAK